MKKTRAVLNTIAIVLFILQVLGYFGSINAPSSNVKGTEAIAYYIGFNFPVILAAILFLISLYLKKKIRKKETDNLIDSIGKD